MSPEYAKMSVQGRGAPEVGSSWLVPAGTPKKAWPEPPKRHGRNPQKGMAGTGTLSFFVSTKVDTVLYQTFLYLQKFSGKTFGLHNENVHY